MFPRLFFSSACAALFIALGVGRGQPLGQPLGKGETWWSLRPVAVVAPPELAGAGAAWCRGPIDRFVYAKLADKKLTPTPEADRRTLIRRLTFDLHGLPPTPAEIDDFLGDSAEGAYERLVERLLASPRYGERWAQHWIDVIHFAETHGHDQDVPREHAWPYRDWLVASLNADKPYRRFVLEQIAGDVLFPDDPAATVALGFLAAGPWDESSLRDISANTIDRKAGQNIDRDDIVGTVTLSLLSTTAQCARCHNHKFDPISLQEYYGLQAIFAGIDRGDRRYVADPAASAKRAELQRVKAALASGGPAAARLLQDAKVGRDIAEWEASFKSCVEWRPLDPATFVSSGGATVTKLDDRSLRFAGVRPERDVYVIEADVDLPSITAVRLEVLGDEDLPHRGPGRQDNGNLHLSEFRVEAARKSEPARKRAAPIARAVADFNQAGWEIDKAIDGVKSTAWGIYPAVGKPHEAVFTFKEPIELAGGARLTFTLEQQHGGGHLIGRPRLSATSAPNPGAASPVPPGVQAILAKPAAARSEKETAELLRHALLRKVDADLAAVPAYGVTYAAVVDPGSTKKCRPVHVLRRGDVKRPLDVAQPGALSCVGVPFQLENGDDEGQRRAALARWIVDPRHPLTWRSIVNRVWAHHFGRGLVATPNDFGKMGATPSHPELLDWLTATFLDDGGSLKALHRRILTSAAYRQGSQFRAEAAKVDGDNALLWRMNVQRLDAESIRDAALAISGKLDSKMGGPSVKRFAQSPGIHRTPKVDYLAFDPDAPGAHRRAVYRFMFRTIPDPFLDTLDCPDSSQFTATRNVSVTALQALALLNDPFMVRMSEHFAARLADHGSRRDQIRMAYVLTLGREPNEREADRLADHAERYGLANACRVLFNCNEFLFVP